MNEFNSQPEQYSQGIQSQRLKNILFLPESVQKQFKLVFKNQLEPLYGSQEDSLKKIFELHDRTACVTLDDEDNISGILVYKNDPVAEYGVTNALEIKTLMLINPEQNGGRGLGALLINEAEGIALENRATSIFVTVAADKPESQQFFIKHGFTAHISTPDAYREGNIETVFVKELDYGDPI